MVFLMFSLLCLIWGSTWMAIKIGLTDAPPMYALSIRFVLSVLMFYAIIAAKRLSLPSTIKDWLRLGYPGIFIYGIAYALVYWAQLYISSVLMAVLFASFPFFVALLSLSMLKAERLSPLAWTGLLIGFAGIVVIFYDSLQTSHQLFIGSLLGLGGTVAAAVGTVTHKRAFAQENILVAATVQITLGTVPVVLVTPFLENLSDFAITTESIGSIIYLSVVGTVVAFIAYYWLLQNTKAVYASLTAFVVPLVALFIGVVLFSEPLTLPMLVGTVLILLGVSMVIKRPGTGTNAA